jgi:Peptidase A4 family
VLLFLAIKLVPPRSGENIAGGFADAPFGPFAGYAWIGKVESVGASFTVPQIASGSPLGEAGTWIGAQGQGPPSRFVQLGEIESRVWSARRQKPVNMYFTFWSDTAHHYQAMPLFPVSPGDTLSASLTLTSRQWTLAIADDISHRKACFSIADEIEAPFSQVEWTQEDPGNENDHARYPQMTAPVFQHLTVNSREPAPAYLALFSEWMSVNKSNLAPTVVHDDSFTLHRAPALTAAGTQYVHLTSAERATFQKFETERSTWTPDTPYRHIVGAISHLTEETQKASRALLSARWPKQIDGLVRSSTNANTAFLEQARPPISLTVATFATWNSRLTNAAQHAATAGSTLRLALGLPGFGVAIQAAHR